MVRRLLLGLAVGASTASASASPRNATHHALGDIYVNHYNGQNPLGIEAAPAREDNYFLVLGDWGKAGGPGVCQLAVADKMKAYVRERTAAGKKLLFVATTGDNFYWTGVQPHSWEISWEAPYGPNDPDSPLHQVPWLGVLGNHDFGNSDPFACCPNRQARARAMAEGQPYGSLQFNADKNPERPDGTKRFWLPDYNYHYMIHEADLEVIAVDTNYFHVKELGGDMKGHSAAFQTCGGAGEVEHFLAKVSKAGQALLRERAAKGYAKTVVILQHYPRLCQKDVFEDALPEWRRKQTSVLCAYGHDHAQECQGYDDQGSCNMLLSGGGGGCCEPEILSAGFAAVSLTQDGGFRAEIGTPDTSVPRGECRWLGWSFDSRTRLSRGAR